MKHIDFVLIGIGYEPKPSAVNRAVRAFMEKGSSNHSPACLLGRYIIKHCVHNGISFSLNHYAKNGVTLGWTIVRGDQR